MSDKQNDNAPESIYLEPDGGELIAHINPCEAMTQILEAMPEVFKYTRSDLVAQGALLEKVKTLVFEQSHRCADIENGKRGWLVLDDNMAGIVALSPDATAALAEHTAKVRNDALREAIAVLERRDLSVEDVDYSNNGHRWVCVGEAQDAIEALITTEGEG